VGALRADLRKRRAEQLATVTPEDWLEPWCVQFFARIDAQLAALERDGAALKKRCNPSLAEVQAAIAAYRAELEEAKTIAIGALVVTGRHESALKGYKAALRRMRR
jgi:hypothetical protein